MGISINYDIGAHSVVYGEDFPTRLRWMKRAGVRHLWLFGYNFGRYACDTETLCKARKILEDEGIEAGGIISLPVGHPGNALNPDDPTLDLAIHPEWHYRIDRNGGKEYFIGCIDDVLVRHNRAAAEEFAQAGFTRHFYDDDLRLGNWGPKVQGCFCDGCIDRFNARTGLKLGRAQLAAACDGAAGMEEIKEAWIQYNCDKVTDFMRATDVPGMTSGIMVMHKGGRQHGISIPDIKKAVPDCLFRVGEYHFDDRSYTAPGGKEFLAESVREHLALIGDNPAFSESTVFPAAALSPENLIDKIRLELSLGLRNIYLMSGSWFLSEPYWKALAENRTALEELALKLDGEK